LGHVPFADGDDMDPVLDQVDFGQGAGGSGQRAQHLARQGLKAISAQIGIADKARHAPQHQARVGFLDPVPFQQQIGQRIDGRARHSGLGRKFRPACGPVQPGQAFQNIQNAIGAACALSHAVPPMLRP